MSITLTAGGKPVESFVRDHTQTNALNAWERAVRRMLELSAETGPKRARVEQMRRWLAANEWHERFIEREAQYWAEYQALNEEFGRVLDESATVVRLQAQLGDRARDGLSALLGHPLAPNAGTHWAVYAQRLGTTDLFAIASAWLMDMRSEDERHEQDVGH